MESEQTITRELFEYELPVGFVKNGFIKEGGKPAAYKYENYLIELLNSSNHFMGITKREKFHNAKEESHGEPDAITKAYSIDFKLILGESMQRAKDLTEQQISIIDKGVVGYGIAKASGRHMAVSLHRALRNLDEKRLEMIRTKEADTLEQRDVKAFLNSIDKDKNLLLLYPAILQYKDNGKIDVQEACNALNDDYGIAIRFIRKAYPDKDTYVGFFHEDALCIGLVISDRLMPIESISVNNSKTFCWLMDFYWQDPHIKRMRGFISMRETEC